MRTVCLKACLNHALLQQQFIMWVVGTQFHHHHHTLIRDCESLMVETVLGGGGGQSFQAERLAYTALQCLNIATCNHMHSLSLHLMCHQNTNPLSHIHAQHMHSYSTDDGNKHGFHKIRKRSLISQIE